MNNADPEVNWDIGYRKVSKSPAVKSGTAFFERAGLEAAGSLKAEHKQQLMNSPGMNRTGVLLQLRLRRCYDNINFSTNRYSLDCSPGHGI